MKVFDTDTRAEILRGNRQVIERRGHVVDEVAITWNTACELSFGAVKSRHQMKNADVVSDFLASLPVLALNLSGAQYFGRIKAMLEGTAKVGWRKLGASRSPDVWRKSRCALRALYWEPASIGGLKG